MEGRESGVCSCYMHCFDWLRRHCRISTKYQIFTIFILVKETISRLEGHRRGRYWNKVRLGRWWFLGHRFGDQMNILRDKSERVGVDDGEITMR